MWCEFGHVKVEFSTQRNPRTTPCDMTCVKSLWLSLPGVETPDSPSRGCQGEWMFLHGVVSPDSPSRGCKGEWIILLEETICRVDAEKRGELDARVVD